MAEKSLEERIAQIEQRNKTVEKDKTWETSYTRRLVIALFTYLSIALYLKFVVRIEPWLNAIIPTVGFLLSTLSLPYIKRVWEKYIQKH